MEQLNHAESIRETVKVLARKFALERRPVEPDAQQDAEERQRMRLAVKAAKQSWWSQIGEFAI